MGMFRSSLFKGLRFPKAEPWSRVATRETPQTAFLFCQAFFFAPPSCKEKSGVTNLGMLTATHQKSLAAFLLAEKGAREKLTKENAVWGVSPSAEGDQGSAFGNRKPLKRLDLNFPISLFGKCEHTTRWHSAVLCGRGWSLRFFSLQPLAKQQYGKI